MNDPLQDLCAHCASPDCPLEPPERDKWISDFFEGDVYEPYPDCARAKFLEEEMQKQKRKCKGFTLAELLIVIAIIAALVAIMIPSFSGQIEKAREAADIANLRSAYAEATSQYLLEPGADATVTVNTVLTSSGAFESVDVSSLPFALPDDFEASKGTFALTFDFSGDTPSVSIAG